MGASVGLDLVIFMKLISVVVEDPYWDTAACKRLAGVSRRPTVRFGIAILRLLKDRGRR
jgi:hypothetical protein